MALTHDLKAELCEIHVAAPNPRKAALATLFRLCAEAYEVDGRVELEVELDSLAVAQFVADEVEDLLGYRATLRHGGQNGASTEQLRRCVLVYAQEAPAILRRLCLVDTSGRPIRGLPPVIIGGTEEDAAGAWRGALLARGTLSEPGRSSALEVMTPGPEVSLALVGLARRLGLLVRARETRTGERITARDGESIARLLQRLGAVRVASRWEEVRHRREVRGTANRLANFDDANLRRSARAAVAAAARVQRALDILGEDVPAHLQEAGELRLQHRQASLDELGRLATPQMTKDAVAGRIRRLLSTADRVAAEQGIPGTDSAVTDELLAAVSDEDSEDHEDREDGDVAVEGASGFGTGGQ